MGAYVRDEPTIEITLSAYFHSDPVEELRTVNQQRVFASVDPFRNPEIRQSRQHAKRTGQAEWETLRQRLVGQGQTYEKQFAVEWRNIRRHLSLDPYATSRTKYRKVTTL